MERILGKKRKEEKLIKKIQRRKERNRRKKGKGCKEREIKERKRTKRENEKYYVLSCVRNYVLGKSSNQIKIERVCYVGKFEVMRD